MNVIFSSSSGPVETSMGKAGVKQLHSALAEVLTDTIPPLGEWGGGQKTCFQRLRPPQLQQGQWTSVLPDFLSASLLLKS